MDDKRVRCAASSPKRRDGIETLEPGKHRVTWECKRKAGKRVKRTRIFRGTVKEARRWRAKQIAEAHKGTAPPDKRRTLGWFLQEHDEKWCNGVSARTRLGYRQAVKTYVTDDLRRKPLESLEPSDLQALFNRMSQRGLSATTVRGLRAVLRRALNRAMKLGYVHRNVATLVDLPKKEPKEIRVLTADEGRSFLREAEEDRLKGLWYVLLTLGLRPSEAFGLMWEDVDGDRLRVRRSLSRLPGRPWCLKETKTGKSRVVVLPEMTVRALDEHRTRQKRERLKAGDAWEENGLIFTTPIGTPLDLNNVRKNDFYPLLEGAGLPRIRLYDLRHSAATLRLLNGDHPKVVQEMLGHASITLTMDTYSHVLPEMQEESAARLDVLLGA